MSDVLTGFFTPWVLYALITVLHLVLPGRWIDGYVRDPDTGEPLRYRLNGLRVLVVMVALWAVAGATGTVPFDFLWTHRWASLAGACTFGLIFSGAIVFLNESTGKHPLADFYLGRLENPQLWGGRLDAKMWLYLIGAVMLELNVLSFVAHHWMTFPGDPSAGVFLVAAMLTWFVCDYLWFEHVHLWTYDLFAERVGFKLGWGCLTFYPFFYAVGLWSVVEQPDPEVPWLLLPAIAMVFFTGWSLARGANMQKWFFKTDPTRRFLGIPQRGITDGSKTLLASGFWGASRHINYLGEILMATGIALAVGYPGTLWPWLYPVYYVALLFPRQRDDDKRCAAKYGELWQRYEAAVPHRIIPKVY